MKKTFILSMLAAFLLSCVPTDDKSIEEAQFLLDEGDFDGAIAIVQPIVDDQPHNSQAKFILASALIGNFALDAKPGCEPQDTGYLGLLACLLDEKEDTDSNGLRTFARIAPEDDSANLTTQIQEAVTLLSSITTFDKNVPEKDVALQRLIARSFDVSTLFQKTHANSCNNSAVSGTFDSTEINSSDANRFVENMEGIQQDADTAGLDLDFRVLTRANAILDDIETIGGTVRDAVRTVFDNAFSGEPSC